MITGKQPHFTAIFHAYWVSRQCGSTGTIYLLLLQSHHHLTPSDVTSKLTTLPHHNTLTT